MPWPLSGRLNVNLAATYGPKTLHRMTSSDLSLLKDSKKRPLTAGTQFKNQMQSLMDRYFFFFSGPQGMRAAAAPRHVPDASLSGPANARADAGRRLSLCSCTPHYIRCVKPNTNKRAGEWDMELCVSQIKYLGLLENVRVRRAGYAFRLPFGHFLRRCVPRQPHVAERAEQAGPRRR